MGIDRHPVRLSHERRTIAALMTPPVIFVAVLFALPTAVIVGRGLGAVDWADLVADRQLRRTVWFTCWQAIASAALTIVVGIVPAGVLARRAVRGRRALLTLVTVPFVLPTVVSATALLATLPTAWHRTAWAMILAHAWVNLALVVRGVGAAWSGLDPDLAAAAATLGAASLTVLRRVTLPLLRPAIASAAALAFLFSFTSFGIARLLGGPAHPTIEVEIWRRATQRFDIAGASVLAVVQLVLVVGLLLRWGRTPVAPRRAGHSAMLPARWPGVVAAGATAIIIVTPLVALVTRSFRPTRNGWGASAWQALVDTPRVGATVLVERPWSTVVASMQVAVVAAGLATVLGLAASLAIVRLPERAARLVGTGLTVPLGASAVAVGLGLLVTFDAGWYDLRGSWMLVPLGQAVVALPVVMRIVGPVVRAIPADLRHAAATLGCGPWRTLRVIDLALARRSIGAAVGFAAAISLGEFGATSLLTRTGAPTAPVAISRLLSRPSPFQVAQASALAVALGLVVVGIVAAVDRWREAGGF